MNKQDVEINEPQKSVMKPLLERDMGEATEWILDDQGECELVIDNQPDTASQWVENDPEQVARRERLEEGYYWVQSGEGVELACYHHWAYRFQNMHHNDEGMQGFKVHRYMKINKPSLPLPGVSLQKAPMAEQSHDPLC